MDGPAQLLCPSFSAKTIQFLGFASAVSLHPFGSSSGSAMLLRSPLGFPVISSALVWGSLSSTLAFRPFGSTFAQCFLGSAMVCHPSGFTSSSFAPIPLLSSVTPTPPQLGHAHMWLYLGPPCLPCHHGSTSPWLLLGLLCSHLHLSWSGSWFHLGMLLSVLVLLHITCDIHSSTMAQCSPACVLTTRPWLQQSLF